MQTDRTSVFPMTRAETEAELERVTMRIGVRVKREDEQRADWARQGVVSTGYTAPTQWLIEHAERLQRTLDAMPACEGDAAHLVVVDAGGC